MKVSSDQPPYSTVTSEGTAMIGRMCVGSIGSPVEDSSLRDVRTKESADIAYEELGLLEAGEVSTSLHDRPMNDVVIALDPCSWGPAVQHLPREHGHTCGNLDAAG